MGCAHLGKRNDTFQQTPCLERVKLESFKNGRFRSILVLNSSFHIKIYRIMSKPLSSFWQNFILGAIRTIKALVNPLLPTSFAREAFELTLQPTERIVNALSDTDPNDKDQIIEIIRIHTNTALVPFAKVQVDELLSKIQDRRLRSLVEVLSIVPFGAANIYTDDVRPNDDQLRTFIEAYLEDGNNQEVLLQDVVAPLLRNILKDQPFVAEFVLGTLTTALDSLQLDLDGDGQ